MSCLYIALSCFLHLHDPAGVACVGFSLVMVAWLVAVEEVELRRGRRAPG